MSDVSDERLREMSLALQMLTSVPLRDDAPAEMVEQRKIDLEHLSIVTELLAARRQPETVPVAVKGEDGWFLPASSLSQPAQDHLNEAIKMAKQSHLVNLKVRFNGEWQTFEADWVKYLALAAGRAEEGKVP